MGFLAAYPKAADGFERLKQDLKKRFSSKNIDKNESIILLDTNISEALTKQRLDQKR
jgi:type I restriction enzyme R subunit